MRQGSRAWPRCPLSPHRRCYLHTSGSGLGFFPQPWAHLAICLLSYLYPVFLSKTKALIPPTRYCASWVCPIIVHGSTIHPAAQAYLLGVVANCSFSGTLYSSNPCPPANTLVLPSKYIQSPATSSHPSAASLAQARPSFQPIICNSHLGSPCHVLGTLFTAPPPPSGYNSTVG